MRSTPEERHAWRESGYFVRPALFSEAELAPLRDAVETVHCRLADTTGWGRTEWVDGKRYERLLGSTVKWEWREGSREVRSMEPFLHLDPRLQAFAQDLRLWAPLLEWIGADRVSLFTDKLNFKRPGGAPFPWHQDTPYWRFGCPHVDRLASVQVYLDEARLDNGCLWVLPGSHRHGDLPTQQDRGVLGRLYTDMERFEGPEPVSLEGVAGTAVYFHGDLVHGSRGNRSLASRRAVVLTYQPAGLPGWRREDVRDVPVEPHRG